VNTAGNFATVFASNGELANADDMPPRVRALASLIEHANLRQAARLPVPCDCGECEGHRQTMRATSARRPS